MIKKQKIDRKEVHSKCNGHCGYCGKEIAVKEMQIDHMEPLFRNHTDKQLEYYKRERGTDHMDNLLPSCARCNRWKSTFTIKDFRNIVQTSLDRLERDTPNFRLAKDFGLIEIARKEVIFYFENNEQKSL
jgi:5-methylcytosine-specific restriction endonuclease McrA